VTQRQSLEMEGAFWSSLEWQAMPKEERDAEWRRHLADLGLGPEVFSGRRVVDVGCGPTGLIYFVDAAERVGVDPLARHYERWNGYFGDPIKLVEADGESIPFPDGHFDAGISVNCIDHTRDPAAVLAELARVLAPGAPLVFHVDLDSPLRKLHKRVKSHVRVMHPHSLTYDWLMEHLEPSFRVTAQARDRETFRPTPAQMRYEAYWDGVLYRLTRSRRWMHHIWLAAERR
jgi:SAM-dependent methyltransferase